MPKGHVSDIIEQAKEQIVAENPPAPAPQINRCELNGNQHADCCSSGLFQVVEEMKAEESKNVEKGPEKQLQKIVPLKEVTLNATIEGVLATIEVTLKYENKETSPINCTYEFPIDKQTLFTDFEAKILDRKIKTKVKQKDKAKMEYFEAVKKAKLAVLAERSAEDT